MTELRQKYEGILLGSLAGDALGAPAEGRSTKQISECFGGYLTDFQTPPDDCLARGRRKYQITDAASIPWLLCEHIAAAGKANRETAKAALRAWGETEWFEPFAGMTTRKVVNLLREDDSVSAWSYAGHLGNKLFKSHYYALSSNGAAVKAYPAALLHPGDEEAAIRTAVELTMASHDDPISISGACAVAAAVSCALGGEATPAAMTEAAFRGAKEGETLAFAEPDIWVYPGPSVADRLEMAVEIAVRKGCDAMPELRDVVGNGPSVAETVPVAFGLLIAFDGEVVPAMQAAANIGDETAADASLTSTLGGALHGAAAFPEEWRAELEKANGLEIAPLAEAMLKLAK